MSKHFYDLRKREVESGDPQRDGLRLLLSALPHTPQGGWVLDALQGPAAVPKSYGGLCVGTAVSHSAISC